MIVPRLELEQILKGDVGEVVSRVSRTVNETVWIRATPRQPPACLARVVDVWPVEDGFSVLLERAADAFTMPDRPAPERPKLRLTRRQRKELFDGGFPHIGAEGPCPVKAGEQVRLSARVTLNVVRVDVKRGRWKLIYEVRDSRDTVRLLRRTPPAHRAGDELDIQDQGAIAHAAEQSFYTSTPGAAVADAGEAPDRGWVEVRTRTVREFDHQRRLAKHAEQQRERARSRRRRAA